MSPLLDHKGNPIPASSFKKADPPKVGEIFGRWAGPQVDLLQLPGGGIVQFDLNKLTLADYRSMTTHYQVNTSLSVLSFMQHQSNWTIECDNSKIADFCTANLAEIWTQLNRAMSQANWSGFSPNVLQWENDPLTNSVQLTKVKDLLPEMCNVNWKDVLGWAPPGMVQPKLKVYDGIKQFGIQWPIPVENSFWYPILMENGDYYGRKLLKAAYTSYFFSMLVHLFSNRYYERFGEPVPIGRAPFDDTITLPDGSQMRSNDYMLNQMMQLRNRSVVVLPSDRGEDTAGRGYFDYDLQYLESQMRGADFERYMQRLDQEISLAIFTPTLLMQTADVGSYNLGQGHMQMYLWMLNALNGDRKAYIDPFILSPMVDYNFGANAPRARIKFQKLDNQNTVLLQGVLTAMIQAGTVKFDMVELGQMAGLTLTQAQVTVAPQQTAPADQPEEDDPPAAKTKTKTANSLQSIIDVQQEILKRVNSQVENAFTQGKFNKDFRLNMGFKRRMEQALITSGIRDADSATESMYARLDAWAGDMSALGPSYVQSPAKFAGDFERLLEWELDHLK